MKSKRLFELVDHYRVEEIEKHLIYSFLSRNDINYSENTILSNYFQEFLPNSDLLYELSEISKLDLKKLENYLELIIPPEDRKVNGAFFTPNYIVDYIIAEINPDESAKCLDPSCGCGAFLIGLVEHFRKTTNKSVSEIIKENIYGSDILDYNIRRSKIILTLYGLLNNENLREDDFNLYFQDSLRSKWDLKFDAIVGNPPYVKFQDLTDDNRDYLINNWTSIDTGTFNLYFAFFELGSKLLSAKGNLGYITPNNYFTSLAGISLRKYFHGNQNVYKIIDFSHQKVFDAQTYTALTFLNNTKNNIILYDKITNDKTPETFLHNIQESENQLDDLNLKKWRLLKLNERENIKNIETLGTPIKDLFNIAVGIATLKDEIFFVDSKTSEGPYLIKETDEGIFKIEKDITLPVYKISQFKNQKDIQNNTLRIITPYLPDTKNAIPIPEEDFKYKYPECYKYLLAHKDRLEKRGKGKKLFKPFYVWGRTQGITRFGKKLLTPTFSKKPRFLFVSEEKSYYTNGYGIYFSKETNDLFENISNPMTKEENIFVVQKILNSCIMDYYISRTSVSIQGGFPCYQKNFIEKFSIPHLSLEEIEYIKSLQSSKLIDAFLIKKYHLNLPSPNLCS